MYHNRPSPSTPALALLCAACLIPLMMPAAARAQVPATRTDYWINTPDSTIAEIVVADTATATPPYPGTWSSITLAGIHDLGRNSPGEDESLAKGQGHWWQSDTTQLGGPNTVQTAWYVIGTKSNGNRYLRSGSGSRRVWTKLLPGIVYAKTSLFRDSQFDKSFEVYKDPAWEARAETYPTDEWPYQGYTHDWLNSTEHFYGNNNWKYGPNPEIQW
jgi:hypothetical protein